MLINNFGKKAKARKKYRENNYAPGFYDIDDSGGEMLEKQQKGFKFQNESRVIKKSLYMLCNN